MGKLRHLGMKKAPNKSTLSYANANRPWEMYRDLFYKTLAVCKMNGTRETPVSAKNKLTFLDSSMHSTLPLLFPRGKSDEPRGL